MYWPDEIRSTGGLDLPEGGETKVRPKELEMARSLVENLSDRFDPEAYKDQYRVALEQLIEAKMRGERRNVKRRKPDAKVIDLMEALSASVEQSRGGRRAKAAPRKGRRRTAA
jgi:DNA end-binding protein Ku